MELAERINRLERSNRRLKIGMGVLGIGATVLAILGAAQPAPRIVTAERFVLVDPSGKERAELSSNSAAAALQFLNSNGSRAAILTAGSNSNGLLLFDKTGRGRQSLLTSQNEATFSIFSANKPKESFTIMDKEQGTVLAIRDAKGNELIDLGQTAGHGASLTFTDPTDIPRVIIANEGILTKTEDGKVEWASFGENLSPEDRKQVMDMLNGQH